MAGWRGLKVWQKLLLIGVTYTLPIIVLIYLYVGESNNSIRFAESELKGNAYQRPLEELLDFVPRHWLAAQKNVNGDAGAKNEMTSLTSQIDSAFENLEAVDRQYGVDLEFTDEGLRRRKRDHLRVAYVKSRWQNIKNQSTSLKAETIDELHAQLTTDIRTMITHAGDTSKLILDPDLDSYYAMDVTLLALPQTQDRVSVVMSFGDSILKRKTITSAERTQLEVYAAMLKEADVDRINASLKTALNEDPNFYGTSESLQRNIPPVLSEYVSANEAFVAMVRQIAASEKVELDPKAWTAAGMAARNASFKLWNVADSELDRLLQIRMGAFKDGRTISLAVTAFVILLASVLVFMITRSITNPLNEAIQKLFTSGNEVASGATQVAASSQRLSEGVSEQASSLEETSASLEEIASMTRQNADNAKEASGLAEMARASAESGNVVVGHMEKAMSEIKAASDDVSKIIKTIDEIAFQTNLLSLNAAVEAARAGEAGRGFGVVAEEVRNLARRSAAAAKESAEKIDAAVAKANIGVATSLKVAQTFKEINANVKKANDLVSEIAAASQEQSQGIQQVTTAVQGMDKVVQSNASDSEEFATTAEQMAAQAVGLKEVVVEMTKMVGDTAATFEQPAKPKATTLIAAPGTLSVQSLNRTSVSKPKLAFGKSDEEKIPLGAAENGKNGFKRF